MSKLAVNSRTIFPLKLGLELLPGLQAASCHLLPRDAEDRQVARHLLSQAVFPAGHRQVSRSVGVRIPAYDPSS